MKFSYALLSLLILITGQAAAQQYAIHLDTSEKTDLDRYKFLRVHGTLYTTAATEGYTSTMIGPFESRQLAGEKLNLIRDSGNYGAYIVKHKITRARAADREKTTSSKNVGFQGTAEKKL